MLEKLLSALKSRVSSDDRPRTLLCHRCGARFDVVEDDRGRQSTAFRPEALERCPSLLARIERGGSDRLYCASATATMIDRDDRKSAPAPMPGKAATLRARKG